MQLLRILPEKELEARLRHELPPGDRLIWSGKPRKLALPAHALAKILGLGLWLGMTFSITLLLQLDYEDEFIEFVRGALTLGTPAVAAAAYLFWWRARARGTMYGVSESRAIMLETVWPARVTVLDLRTIHDVRMEAGAGDEGTLHFGPALAPPARSPRFENVRHVREVFERVRRAQKGEAAVEEALG